MSHYDKFEYDKFMRSIPVGNVDDLLGFENRPVRKHTAGKAEGARFCYVGHLAAVSEFSGCVEDYLSNSLDNLINHSSLDDDFTEIVSSIISHSGDAMGGQEELWAGVIAVRNHALKSGKYTPESYKEPIDVNLLLDAMARHLIAYLFVGRIDKESGQNHIAHIVANVVMYVAQMEIPQ